MISLLRIGRPFLFIFSLFLFLTNANATQAPLYDGTPLEIEDEIFGAPFRIRVPADWNGTLLVYAHGYTRITEPAIPLTPMWHHFDPLMEDYFLERGYALAASAFAVDGWAVKQGIWDTLILTWFFKVKVAKPEQTILWGISMGSVIVSKIAELYPHMYQAFLPMCQIGGGSNDLWDTVLAGALAYDTAFGWDPDWGSIDDVRNDINFATDVLPVVSLKLMNPANFGKFEFFRLVNHYEMEGFYTQPNPYELPAVLYIMFFLTQGKGRLEEQIGGLPSTNTYHTYTIKDDTKAYLSTLGVDADALLAQMNERTDIYPDSCARKYLEDYTGRIRKPVLTLHATGDPATPPHHAGLYRDIVEFAGKDKNLAQTFTDTVGHCDFTYEQYEAILMAVEYWLDTGEAPGSEFFPEDLGFIPDLIPPPHPHIPQ